MATWIFQTNPKYFDIDSQLTEESIIFWSIRQPKFVGEVKPNDTVFLWRAAGHNPGTGGVIAKTIVIGDADDKMWSEEERKRFWRDDGWKKTYPLVELDVLNYRLDASEGYISRTELKKHPILRKLHILSAPRWTNYRLDGEEAFELEKMWASKALPLDEDAQSFVEGAAKYRLHLKEGEKSKVGPGG